MGITDYFKPVLTISAAALRRLLKDKKPGDYTLIDVRQPGEYGQGHIPGAQLVPLGDLRAQAGGLDPSKPTIAY